MDTQLGPFLESPINREEGEALNAFEWAGVFRALKPFLRPFGSSGEGRTDTVAQNGPQLPGWVP